MDGAIRVSTGCIELPQHALKGEAYECLECRRAVFPRQGDIRQAHFCHKASANPCRFYDPPAGGGESETHRRAKLILENILKTKRDLTIRRVCRRCFDIEPHMIATTAIKSVHQEWAVEGGVADVVAVLDDGKEIVFEVFHTHSTRSRPGEWYELTAGEISAKYSSVGEIVLECVRPWRCDGCERHIVAENVERERRHEKARQEWLAKIAVERARAARQEFDREKQLEKDRSELAEQMERYRVESEKRRAAQTEQLEREREEFRKTEEQREQERNKRTDADRQKQIDEVKSNMSSTHEWALSREEKQRKLDILRVEERAWYKAELDRQEKRYNEVYAEFYQKFVVNNEEIPVEWSRKNMWGEVCPDVIYKGCYFMNPAIIKSRSAGRE